MPIKQLNVRSIKCKVTNKKITVNIFIDRTFSFYSCVKMHFDLNV